MLSYLCTLSSKHLYIVSTSCLSVANEKNQLSSKLGSFSTLAGIAGVSLPTDTNNPSAEAVARMKSFDFFSTLFLPNILLKIFTPQMDGIQRKIIFYMIQNFL